MTSEQREELERWAQSRALRAGDVYRARLILALADGLSYREIERTLGASAPTVSKWRSRFEESGVAGLQGQHQGSKPRTATPAYKRESFAGPSRNQWMGAHMVSASWRNT